MVHYYLTIMSIIYIYIYIYNIYIYNCEGSVAKLRIFLVQEGFLE